MRKAAREKMGTEGEDVVADPSGGLKLRMPMRMGIGTVKAAAWHVRCSLTLRLTFLTLRMSSIGSLDAPPFVLSHQPVGPSHFTDGWERCCRRMYSTGRCPLAQDLSRVLHTQVLAEVDADGINTAELARRIQRSGLRDLRSSKTPEASLAGALARDVIFCRVAPSTFALQAVVNYERWVLP